MNLVIRKIGRCPPFSHMGDLLNTCMLWIGLFECHILLENPVEFRYEPEFWLSFRFRSTESGIFKNTTPVPAQPEPDFQYIQYPAGYSGSVSGLILSYLLFSEKTYGEWVSTMLLHFKNLRVHHKKTRIWISGRRGFESYYHLINAQLSKLESLYWMSKCILMLSEI